MFNFSSSSSDSHEKRTRTITVAYADSPSRCESMYETSAESSSYSTESLCTLSTFISAQSELDQLDRLKEKEKFFGYHPIWQEMSLSEGVKLKTLEYFWECKIFQLFNFLMTHLLAHTPKDPVSFLTSVVDRCIRYRDEDGDPPLVFEESHVNSIYVALDPMLEGSISYRQYLAGMQTLGLTEFNVMPEELDFNQHMPKDVFIREAKNALIRQLNLIVGKGRDTSTGDEEENVPPSEDKTEIN